MRGCEAGPLQHGGKGLQLPNLFSLNAYIDRMEERQLLIHLGIYWVEMKLPVSTPGVSLCRLCGVVSALA